MLRGSLNLRAATRDDLAALQAVDPLLATQAGRAAHLGELIGAGLSWVAEQDGAPVGYAVVTRRFFDRPFVDLLVVAEGARRQGIGAALMEKALESRQAGDDRVFTSTNESNAPMRTLLAKAGWQVSGIIENLDPGDPELVFVKFV